LNKTQKTQPHTGKILPKDDETANKLNQAFNDVLENCCSSHIFMNHLHMTADSRH
jgi:hypothetical protein